MDDLWVDFAAYTERTITLRLTREEASILNTILCLVPLSDPNKEAAVALGEKVASEYLEHFSRG